jgi:hypothetical protein
VAGKLPRGGDQPVGRDTGEVGGQRFVGKSEFLVAGDVWLITRDLAHAVFADRRFGALQRDGISATQLTAEFAAIIEQDMVSVGCLARNPERMTRLIDALPCSFQHCIGDVAWKASTTRFAIFGNFFHKTTCVFQRLLEDHVHDFDHEIDRRFIVVVKDDLAVGDWCLGLTHWNTNLAGSGIRLV